MGIHYYDCSPYPKEAIMERLEPARVITDSQISCVVWAEDALSFAHYVPTSLFSLQLLVPDNLLETAVTSITSHLPYHRLLEPHFSWLDYKIMDPNRPSCFPSSVALEITTPEAERDPNLDTPWSIFIHPASYFHMDARDKSLSLPLSPPLPSAYSEIRFPTRTAFLDALISTLLDPPLGYRHGLLSLNLMCYYGYIIMYTQGIREKDRVLPNGKLESEHAALCASLRPENRPFFEANCRGQHKIEWRDHVATRRAVLERIGGANFISKPFPRDRYDIWKRQQRKFCSRSSFRVNGSPQGHATPPITLTRKPTPPAGAVITRSLYPFRKLIQRK